MSHQSQRAHRSAWSLKWDHESASGLGCPRETKGKACVPRLGKKCLSLRRDLSEGPGSLVAALSILLLRGSAQEADLSPCSTGKCRFHLFWFKLERLRSQRQRFSDSLLAGFWVQRRLPRQMCSGGAWQLESRWSPLLATALLLLAGDTSGRPAVRVLCPFSSLLSFRKRLGLQISGLAS